MLEIRKDHFSGLGRVVPEGREDDLYAVLKAMQAEALGLTPPTVSAPAVAALVGSGVGPPLPGLTALTAVGGQAAPVAEQMHGSIAHAAGNPPTDVEYNALVDDHNLVFADVGNLITRLGDLTVDYNKLETDVATLRTEAGVAAGRTNDLIAETVELRAKLTAAVALVNELRTDAVGAGAGGTPQVRFV